ncbi:putative ABC transport system permease protein [Paenibacillus sophorae]|uniref:ABC transporter permease n=1 Tax=Paenibacillus sophorae TaxID=1333845 RepID=A0A1H8LLB7_9BACL|nr:ABC transporter permease [Paenibacillus sophorae]QWU17245.1 ABC transporter permease [Paenibacillus sophorae]SEO05869.1 putative ABC transport system permease protein [Paenibacillus sophorae]
MSFPQFAFNNIRRNARSYIAFFLSSAFMVMVFFAYAVFMFHPDVTSIELGENSAAGMKIASYIVFIFAFFFVLYSISAFLKSRNLEFGILTILGARPGQINKLIFMENMLIGLFSILTGMAGGLLLSKMFLLLSTKMIGIANLPLYWPVKAIVVTAAAFLGLFIVISAFTLLFIRKNRVLELLKGTSKPKKEPKASLLLSALCIALLAAGYWAIRQPLDPKWLLTAAVTGIAGTYFFYTQLSVLTISLLKLSRRRLWRGTNLLWISEMAYKLKDNARMLFLVTVVTSLACMASSFLLSINNANKDAYVNSPFAFTYTTSHLSAAAAEKDTQLIRDRLQAEGLKYTENKVGLLHGTIVKEGKFIPFNILPLDRYNELAPQMGREAEAGLSGSEILLIHSNDFNIKDYAKDNRVKLLEYPGQTFIVKKTLELPTSPFGQYAAPLLVISGDMYNQLAVKGSALTMFLYKVPALDGQLPAAGSRTALLSTELADTYRDRDNQSHGLGGYLSARDYLYLTTKQGASMLGFIGIFIALIFSVSSASFLYFRLHSELAADQRMYRALSKIGLSPGEMSGSATRQIALLFYIPILVAWVQTLVVLRPVMVQIQVYEITVPVLMTIGAFLAVQTLYFAVVRSRYVHSLKRTMV